LEGLRQHAFDATQNKGSTRNHATPKQRGVVDRGMTKQALQQHSYPSPFLSAND